jgi:glutaconate CoA-transferase subunit B
MLARAAQEIADGDWVFTGFHWPVVVAYAARLSRPSRFTQVVEAGGAINALLDAVPSSTTDFAVFAGRLCYAAGADVTLRTLGRRYDITMLDAGTVDIRGRLNSTAIGPMEQPKVRLAGGGGAPDAAYAARRLVLLHGGSDLRRIQARVEHVTSAPGPRTSTVLITRYGVVALGPAPRLLELVDSPGGKELAARLLELGVELGIHCEMHVGRAELLAARQAISAAAAAGYTMARAISIADTGG